jgi:SagB-type dehydrogenase family enzyme
MRIKRSSAIVLLLDSDRIVVHNFLTQTTFAADRVVIDIVSRLANWTDDAQVKDSLGGYSSGSVEDALRQLVDLDVLIVEGSEAARRDARYEQNWLWGPFAAAYHFGSQGGVFMSDAQTLDMLGQVAKVSPSPPLYRRNPAGSDTLAAARRPEYGEPFQTMAARRTNRLLLDAAIPFDVVADCLLFSMAITAILEFPEVGDLPLKMTPSGGARNPYEAFVLARKVDGLPAGVHHYSAIDQTFGLLRPGHPPPFPTLLGRQEWTATAAAVIVLVANFDRPMWKYHDPSAYRVTAIEAGHIAQNMLLVATKHGVAANPTAFLAITELEDTLGLDGLTQYPMYAVALGRVAPHDDGDLAAIADPS